MYILKVLQHQHVKVVNQYLWVMIKKSILHQFLLKQIKIIMFQIQINIIILVKLYMQYQNQIQIFKEKQVMNMGNIFKVQLIKKLILLVLKLKEVKIYLIHLNVHKLMILIL